MSKTQNPFEFNFGQIADMLKSPVTDIEQIISIQRRNIEGATAANQMIVEGIQSYCRRQAEIAREAMEDAGSILSDIAAAGSPEDKIIRQLERAKKSYDAAINNIRELAELATRSSTEASDVMASRISDSIDEIKNATKKATTRRRAA